MKDSPHFKTNVLLKNIVGKDLINDDNIAVLELVKNSYDAGAKTVELYFRNLFNSVESKPETPTDGIKGKTKTQNQPEPEIMVVDAGSGMTRNDLENKWLNIAYSDKKNKTTKQRRMMAGNKGVGRFSCDRLGAKLDLFTRVPGGDLLYLSVNWEDYEVENAPDLEIQAIPVLLKKTTLQHLSEVTGLSKLPKGTILRITHLRSQWTRESLLRLRRYLERLFNPNQAFEKEKFRLTIIAPDFKDSDKDASLREKINGTVSNEIFERLDFKTTNIESTIDLEGELITTVLSHDGKMVYRVVERNELSKLKNVKTVIYYLNPYKKGYFKKQTDFDSVEFGSIFLFINGFRIPPYGDRGDDWLGLDVRKTQGMQRFIGTRDLVGRIEIDDHDSRFKIVSSREGIVKDETYEQLVKFYFKAHHRLENFVVDGLQWDSLPEDVKQKLRSRNGSAWNEKNEQYRETEAQKIHRVGENLLSVLNAQPEKVVALKIDADLLEQISSQNRETVNKILSHFEKYDSSVIDNKLSVALGNLKSLVERQDRQLEKLKRTVVDKESRIAELKVDAASKEREILFLKSISTLDQEHLLNCLHQVGIDSATIRNTVDRLLSKIANGESLDKDQLATALERISFANRKILSVQQFATKANFRMDSQSIRADLVQFVQQYLTNVAKDFIASGLTITIEGGNSGPFEIKLKPIEISMLIDNLLSNAKKAGAKQVTVQIKRIASNHLEMVFIDNGKGFSPEIRKIDDIFRKGFTTTNGSGLGLYHVSQILQGINGTITAAPANPKGVAFTITVKK
jgi:signal transduction histidine kinase